MEVEFVPTQNWNHRTFAESATGSEPVAAVCMKNGWKQTRGKDKGNLLESTQQGRSLADAVHQRRGRRRNSKRHQTVRRILDGGTVHPWTRVMQRMSFSCTFVQFFTWITFLKKHMTQQQMATPRILLGAQQMPDGLFFLCTDGASVVFVT